MDNLTHSLTGAVLGQMGLKKKTGLGMATLIIAANIPDIDAVAVLLDGHQHLAIRRGITHGPIAMLVLPLILTGIMILFDGWQAKRGKRPADRLPIHKGWLLALAFIGTLSHPAMDWLNNYGVRLLEPFSSTWYYGDSIFIIDIWIWIALIAGVWISRKREKNAKENWQRPAWISFAAICGYVFANGLITGKAESDTADTVAAATGKQPDLVVANPVPLTFWKREMIWQMSQVGEGAGGNVYGQSYFNLFDPSLSDQDELVRNNISEKSLNWLRNSDGDAADFLFWSRMPILQIDPSQTGDEAVSFKDGVGYVIGDMRFRHPMAADRFSISAIVPWSIASDELPEEK